MSNTTAEKLDKANLKELRPLAKEMFKELTEQKSTNERLDVILERILKLEYTLEKRDETIEALDASVASLETANEKLATQVTALSNKLISNERETTHHSQSLRRRQLVLSINNGDTLERCDDLKKTACQLLAMSESIINTKDIGLCRKIGKKDKSILIELNDQRARDNIMRNRKKLKGKRDTKHGNLYISEAMCPSLAKLDYICRRMKSDIEIGLHDTWFFNGRLTIVLVEDGPKVTIGHIQDLYDLFDDNIIDDLVSSN